MRNILGWVIPIAIGLFAALLIRMFVYLPVTVNGDSMLNTLVSGQKVSAIRTATIHRGSVIAFNAVGEDPGVELDAGQKSRYYIKRVIGLPGDTIRSDNGTIYVNGKKINNSYLTSVNKTTGTGTWDLQSLSSEGSKFVSGNSHWNDGYATKVPADNYFVLGDNRQVSEDSRYFGFVKKENVLGVTFVFPWSEDRQDVNLVWKNFFAN
jgi:signal peptidase I